MISYALDDFYSISRTSNNYILPSEVLEAIQSLKSQIVPIHVEKSDKKDSFRKKYIKPTELRKESAKELFESFKPKTVIEEKPEGIEKWLENIQFSLNKMSSKNYENQKNEILEKIDKCIAFASENDDLRKDIVKKVIDAIFNFASINKFYVEVYAKLYKELLEISNDFKEPLAENLNAFINGIQDIQYIDPELNYEQYCINTKKNDIRKSLTIFIVQLMKKDIIPVLEVLNIMADFQKYVLEFIDRENKTNEIDEISEILYLFLKEGKDVFQQFKEEWIWKFMIKQNIDTISKYSRKEKKGLSSRSIFKYKDMVELIDN